MTFTTPRKSFTGHTVENYFPVSHHRKADKEESLGAAAVVVPSLDVYDCARLV